MTPTPEQPDVRELARLTIRMWLVERDVDLRGADDLADELLAAVTPVIRRQVAEEIAQAIEDNVRNEDWSKQDRGGFIGFPARMAYVGGHDKAAAIARSHSTQPTETGQDHE